MARQQFAGNLASSSNRRATHRAGLHERDRQRTRVPQEALTYSLAVWTSQSVNARGSEPLTIAGLLQANRSCGNRAVQRHLRCQTAPAATAEQAELTAVATTRNV